MGLHGLLQGIALLFLKEIECDVENWILLAHDKEK
jgi:hypothetical protein